MLCLAAIYLKEKVPQPDNPQFIQHYVILMTQSSYHAPHLKQVHHRMPVYLDEKTLRMWLDSEKYCFEECEDIIEKLDVWK